jgi:hypothetical protein
MAWADEPSLVTFHHSEPTGAVESVIVSPTRRFLVDTDDRRRDADLPLWLESIADRIEQALGDPLPADSARPLVVVIRRNPQWPAGCRRQLHRNSSGLGQTLRVNRPEEVPTLEFLGAVTSLLLARYVALHQSSTDRDRRPAVPPEWLAVGLAGTLFPAPRQSSIWRAVREWEAERDPPVEMLFNVSDLHQTTWDPAPYWVTWVAWLRREKMLRAFCAHAFRSTAEGQTCTLPHLVRWVDPMWTVRDFRQHWDLVLASFRRLEVPWKETDVDRLNRIRRALALTRADWPHAWPSGVSEPITPETLVSQYGEAWVGVAAGWMLTQLERVPAGPDEAIQDVVHQFRALLYTLAQPPPRGDPWSGLARWLQAWQLSRHLRRARAAFDRVERDRQGAQPSGEAAGIESAELDAFPAYHQDGSTFAQVVRVLESARVF